MLSHQLGSNAAYELRQLERDRFPVLLIVHRVKGTVTVEHVIRAPCTLEELMNELVHGLDSFNHQNHLDRIEEVCISLISSFLLFTIFLLF